MAPLRESILRSGGRSPARAAALFRLYRLKLLRRIGGAGMS
jgi:hypothetical protein